MRKKRRFGHALLLLVFGSVSLLLIYYKHTGSEMNERKDQDNHQILPFDVRRETRTDGHGGPMWTALVLVKKEHYTRENLDAFFCSYSKQHPDKNERLQVRVYTNAEDLPTLGAPTPPSKPDKNTALFNRQGDGALGGGGRNEEYFYYPDPDDLRDSKRVVLRGISWAARKTILKSWDFSHDSIKIRARAYTLESIDPPGVYYSFESFDGRSKEWRTIITFQQEGEMLFPSDNVHFIDTNITYISIGSLFAVTLDRGKSWSTWDAGRDLSGVACLEQVSIEQVSIDQRGEGYLTLRFSSNDSVKKFGTKDFGCHWLER